MEAAPGRSSCAAESRRISGRGQCCQAVDGRLARRKVSPKNTLRLWEVFQARGQPRLAKACRELSAPSKTRLPLCSAPLTRTTTRHTENTREISRAHTHQIDTGTNAPHARTHTPSDPRRHIAPPRSPFSCAIPVCARRTRPPRPPRPPYEAARRASARCAMIAAETGAGDRGGCRGSLISRWRSCGRLPSGSGRRRRRRRRRWRTPSCPRLSR